MPHKYTEIRDRPEHIQGITRQVKCGCGNMYITINEDAGDAFEVFTVFGKSGTCVATTLGALATAISLGLRANPPISLEEYAKRFVGHSCEKAIPAVQNKGAAVHSCIDALGHALLDYHQNHKFITSSPASQQESPPPPVKTEPPKEVEVKGGKVCRQCGGGPVVYEGGCDICKACGASDDCP